MVEAVEPRRPEAFDVRVLTNRVDEFDVRQEDEGRPRRYSLEDDLCGPGVRRSKTCEAKGDWRCCVANREDGPWREAVDIHVSSALAEDPRRQERGLDGVTLDDTPDRLGVLHADRMRAGGNGRRAKRLRGGRVFSGLQGGTASLLIRCREWGRNSLIAGVRMVGRAPLEMPEVWSRDPGCAVRAVRRIPHAIPSPVARPGAAPRALRPRPAGSRG